MLSLVLPQDRFSFYLFERFVRHTPVVLVVLFSCFDLFGVIFFLFSSVVCLFWILLFERTGARKEGVGGFFKGLGKGLLGVVTKPVVGVVDFTAKTFQVVIFFRVAFRPTIVVAATSQLVCSSVLNSCRFACCCCYSFCAP